MASTTLNVAVPRARAVASRARRAGMPPARPASRRGVRCAAGEEVPLGVQIETALMDAFAPSGSVTRVRDSLRFTLADGTYKKTHAGLGEQVASSYIAGLTARPYWDARGGDFPWMEHLERNHETIRDELRAALADPLLQQKGNAIWVAAARDDAEGYGPDWRTLVLQDRCEWEPTNVTLFPETVALVRAARAPSVEVFFAKQAPGTGIKPHTDFTNFIMTAHLGLDVPPKPESWMKVGEETRYWENGVGMCADTSFIHSTSNDSAEKDRYVLIVRFWHPELTSHERNGVRFLFDAFEDLTPEGLRRARDNARAREKADAEAARERTDERPPTNAEARPRAEPSAPGGGRKRNKRNKRKAASRSSGDGLGLLAKGMK